MCLQACGSMHVGMVIQQHGFFSQHGLTFGWTRQDPKITPLFAPITETDQQLPL